MEQARILVAIALSFAVFLIWEIFFVERPTKAPPAEQTQQTAAKTPTTPETGPVSTPQADMFSPEAVRSETALEAAGRAKRITVETPLYTAVLSESGATIRNWKLRQYREAADPGAAAKELVGEKVPGGSVQTLWGKPMAAAMENGRFFLSSGETEVKVTDLDRSVRFSWQSPDGVRVEKTYTFSPNSYLVHLAVTVQNGAGRPLVNDLGISLRSLFDESSRAIGFQGASARVDGRIEQIDVGDVDEEALDAGKVQWISLQDRYFLSALIPVVPVQTNVALSSPAPGIVENRFVQPGIELAPGAQKQYDYKLFFGPKSMRVLGEAGYDLNRAIDFGWFDFIAKPCLWLMNFIYRFIPNYGVAIICLTLITKILLWPLGNKSYKSMGEMKKIQPLMAEIREKYKNDKKKMNQEMMALYRTYKINPVGGCLPMAAQIPVFIALYRMLYEAIELRHAPFFGWINDLSAPDRLFEFPFSIPLMQEPHGIPVLTLVMGASMLLQQKMSPPPGDPSQAKIMMLMPIVFTVIFINFPSGLVLYWLVNNLFSMAQQYYTQKKHA